ncbi:E3 ubiquitin-protein ligase Trim36-like [Gigantopelta aegis]|uniref:E3 ubiquitin-protein ligase Trim36-like n=1 Tax=Gigantopelta aegis TaxID=1735272 RepID=UPI001B889905|nr:E3 ubiquitin-protein ligase Trim36-like [Gigantopelta aegis]
MEADLTCTVCLDLYTEPHLLPCSHNLCRECVRTLIKDNTGHGDAQTMSGPEADESQLVDSSISESMSDAIHQLSNWFSTHITANNTNKAKTLAGRIILCPQCRAKYDVGPDGVDQFPKNLTLENIVATYKSSRKVLDSMTDSEDELGESTVTDNDVNKSASKESKSAVSDVLVCAQHNGKRNKMFCNTCNRLVCSSCALFGDHKGHDIVKLRSALRMGKRLLEDEHLRVEEMQLNLLKRKDAIVEYSCKLDAIKTTQLEYMRKEVVKIVSHIQCRENEIAEKIRNDVQQKKTILDSLEKDTAASSEMVQNLSSEILKVLSISDPMEFLSIYMPVVERSRGSSILLHDLDPSLKTVSGQLPDFKYLNTLVKRGLMKSASHELVKSTPKDNVETLKTDEAKKVLPGHIAKCQFMEQFYVVEDLIDVAIGAGGANIQEARQVDGVTSVELEFGDMCAFKFYGTSQESCDTSRDILQQAMIRYMSKN